MTMIVLLGGGLLGLLFLLRWPWLVWPLFGAALPVLSGSKIGPLSLADLALAGAGALWFADGVRRRTLLVPSSPLQPWLLAYLAALALALLPAANLGEALTEVVKWAEVLAVLLLVRAMLPPAQRHWLVMALVLGGVSQALYGLYQFIFRIGPEWFVLFDRFMRASGSFGQPNPFAGYLGLTLPVAFSLALWAWGRVWRTVWQSQQPVRLRLLLLWAVVYTAATGVIAAGLFASWSRGGWLGAAAAISVVLVVRSRQSAIIGGLAGLLVVLALLLGSFSPQVMPPVIGQRIAELPAFLGLTDILNEPVTDENFSILERLAHWVAAVRMWERSPWFGVGPGNYNTVYPDVRLPRWEEPLGHAHNIYLNVLAESGLVGFGAFLALWSAAVISVWRQGRQAARHGASWQAASAIGTLGVLAHLGVHSFFDNLFVQGMYLHLALWLALTPADTTR
jgi:O-antigen ligase